MAEPARPPARPRPGPADASLARPRPGPGSDAPAGPRPGAAPTGSSRGPRPAGPAGPDAPAATARPADPQRICGLAAVRATFLVRPQAVLRLFHLPARQREVGPLCAHLARTRRPYREVGEEELARIAGTTHHGGIVAITEPRQAEPLPGHALPQDLPAAAVLPVLDGIGNPHNLGAIARSAAFFGARGLLLSGDARQADLSDAAYRTAEGGLEWLRVLRARELPVLLKGMRPRFLTVAAVAAGGVPPEALPRDRPIALVLGNEETGLPAATIAACEARVTLPGGGRVQSLNAAAAAAVLLHALMGR